MKFEFNLKTKTKFGKGEAENIGKYLVDLGIKHPGIIIDKGVAGSDYGKIVLNALEGNHLYYDYGEPTYDLLEKFRYHFKADGLVAIGGGSVIDFAKGMAFLATNKKNAIEYRGFPKKVNHPLPVVAVPTTAGTGSEITYNAVFIDTKEKRKLGINTELNYPVLAILDPQLTLTCPIHATISSGMDALIHAVESYSSMQSNSLTRMFAERAFCTLFNNLWSVVTKPSSIIVRSNLLFGSYLAMISFMNSGAGPAHAMGYILSPLFNVPHGLAGAVFFPKVVKHNISKGFSYANLVESSCLSKENFSDIVRKLYNRLGIFPMLGGFGVNKGNVDNLLERMETLESIFKQNPVPFTVSDAKRLVKGMI